MIVGPTKAEGREAALFSFRHKQLSTRRLLAIPALAVSLLVFSAGPSQAKAPKSLLSAKSPIQSVEVSVQTKKAPRSKKHGLKFLQTIKVTNTSTDSIDEWKLGFVTKAKIKDAKDAKLTHKDHAYTLTPKGAKADLRPNKSQEFSYETSSHKNPVEIEVFGTRYGPIPSSNPSGGSGSSGSGSSGTSGGSSSGPSPTTPTGPTTTVPPTTTTGPTTTVPPTTTTGPTTTTPPTGIVVVFDETYSQAGAYEATMTIENNTSQAVSGWTLTFSAVGLSTVTTGEAQVTQSGSTFTLVSYPATGSIPAGGTMPLALVGKYTAAPVFSDCKLNTMACTVQSGSGPHPTNPTTPPTIPNPPPPASSAISISGVTGTALTMNISGTGTTTYSLSASGATTFGAASNNTAVAQATISGSTLTVNALTSGRASLSITDDNGDVRVIGLQILDPGGNPPGIPGYLNVGSFGDNTQFELPFFADFGPDDPIGRRVDSRYEYINGGPYPYNQGGWYTWGAYYGSRAVQFVQQSLQLGHVPYFVYYNIADGQDNISAPTYMVQKDFMWSYFADYKVTLEIANTFACDTDGKCPPVGFIMEPDFLGSVMNGPGNYGSTAPQSITVAVSGAYAGADPALDNPGCDAAAQIRAAQSTSPPVPEGTNDPCFAGTLTGLVQAMNYMAQKYASNVQVGWEFSLWGLKANPIPAINAAGQGGYQQALAAVSATAETIAEWNVQAGVLSYGADFIVQDKYGLDGGCTCLGADAATDPAGSTWFWNADVWKGYLAFIDQIHTTTGLPVVLWQLPVGHIDSSTLADPYPQSPTAPSFPNLDDTSSHGEDSTPSYFFGDTFVQAGLPDGGTGGPNLQAAADVRFDYFSQNWSNDPEVQSNSTTNTITWGSHMTQAAQAGAISLMFGPGVGDSTRNVPNSTGDVTDGCWAMTAMENYFADGPTPLAGQALPPDGRATKGDSRGTDAGASERAALPAGATCYP